MLRPPSLLGVQTSGFVPFSAGGSVHGELDERVATTVTPSTLRVTEPVPAVEARPSPVPVAPSTVAWRSATWAPAASRRIRVVEAVVLAAVGAYFSLGLVKLVGWL